MRTVRTKVYKFSELSEQAKTKAIEQFRDINVDHDWWDFTYEDFKSLCATIGVDVDLKKTFFNGFYTQGSGSSFTADIDIFKLIEGVKSEAWKQYAPDAKLEFYPITKNMERVAHFMSAAVEPHNRETSVNVTANNEADQSYNDLPNVNKAILELEEFLQDVADNLNHWLFTSLEKEFDYLMSDEAVIETIEANEYEFTKDGKQF